VDGTMNDMMLVEEEGLLLLLKMDGVECHFQ
jgi:hypothetical protein